MAAHIRSWIFLPTIIHGEEILGNILLDYDNYNDTCILSCSFGYKVRCCLVKETYICIKKKKVSFRSELKDLIFIFSHLVLLLLLFYQKNIEYRLLSQHITEVDPFRGKWVKLATSTFELIELASQSKRKTCNLKEKKSGLVDAQSL